jgi:hypothetical protein
MAFAMTKRRAGAYDQKLAQIPVIHSRFFRPPDKSSVSSAFGWARLARFGMR